jgi:hypothetical protein
MNLVSLSSGFSSYLLSLLLFLFLSSLLSFSWLSFLFYLSSCFSLFPSFSPVLLFRLSCFAFPSLFSLLSSLSYLSPLCRLSFPFSLYSFITLFFSALSFFLSSSLLPLLSLFSSLLSFFCHFSPFSLSLSPIRRLPSSIGAIFLLCSLLLLPLSSAMTCCSSCPARSPPPHFPPRLFSPTVGEMMLLSISPPRWPPCETFAECCAADLARAVSQSPGRCSPIARWSE